MNKKKYFYFLIHKYRHKIILCVINAPKRKGGFPFEECFPNIGDGVFVNLNNTRCYPHAKHTHCCIYANFSTLLQIRPTRVIIVKTPTEKLNDINDA